MFDRYFHLFIIMTYMTGICQKTLCYCDSYECTEWTSNIMELIQIWNIILDQNFWFQWMYNNLLFQGPNARTATIDSNTNKSFNLLYFTVFTNKSKVPEDRRTTNYLNSLSMNVLWTFTSFNGPWTSTFHDWLCMEWVFQSLFRPLTPYSRFESNLSVCFSVYSSSFTFLWQESFCSCRN